MTRIGVDYEKSLNDLGLLGASRSAHVGNITLRDLLLLFNKGKLTPIDTTKISDKAYKPGYFAFDGNMYPLVGNMDDNDKMTFAYIVDQIPDIKNTCSDLYEKIEQARDTTVNLPGFYLEFTKLALGDVLGAKDRIYTRSQHIERYKAIVKDVLCTLINNIGNKPDKEKGEYIEKFFGRYITPGGYFASYQKYQEREVYYRDKDGTIYTVSFDDIVDNTFTLHKNLAILHKTTDKGSDKNLLGNISGVYPSNVCNIFLDMMISWKTRGNGKDGANNVVYHVGGQAMSAYIKGKGFQEDREEIISLYLTHGGYDDQIPDSYIIVPAHEWRFAYPDKNYLKKVEKFFEIQEKIKYLGQKMGAAKQSGDDQKFEQLKQNRDSLNETINQITTENAGYFASYHPEFIKSGTLCEGHLPLSLSTADIYMDLKKDLSIVDLLSGYACLNPEMLKQYNKKIARKVEELKNKKHRG